MSDKINTFLKDNYEKLSLREIALKFGVSESTIRRRVDKLGLVRKSDLIKKKTPEDLIQEHKDSLDSKATKNKDNKALNFLIKENEQLKKEKNAFLDIKNNVKPYYFDYKISDNKGESIAVAVASDWHIEEEVKPETVNGLNKYTLTIAEQRAEEFFVNTLKLVKKEQHDSRIDTLVLALLGDFITGNIHTELLETCQLRPIDASIKAMNLISGGIDYLLKNSDLKLIIPCAVGNHTRITKQVHIGTEQGNSLETFLYHTLKDKYKDNKRVTFLIAEGYLSYLTLWNFTICFQHGHAIKYGGGVGGLTIPMNKAVAQWEKLRHADLYVAGHWHQFFDGGNFIINGSMIGYNPFAIWIKANFERPKQAFFLINKKRNCKTVVCPILFDI
jgi:hypothetical protein